MNTYPTNAVLVALEGTTLLHLINSLSRGSYLVSGGCQKKFELFMYYYTQTQYQTLPSDDNRISTLRSWVSWVCEAQLFSCD